jgi:hypothetical protein
MMLKKLVAFSAGLTLVTVLAGCTGVANKSDYLDGWDAGYDDQYQLKSEKSTSNEEAFAYCSTFAENNAKAASKDELKDYIDGCVAWMTEDLVADEEAGSEDAVAEEEEVVDTTVIGRLNQAGKTKWNFDKFQDMTGSAVEDIILGTASTDQSVCAVWVFPDEEAATSAAENGEFDWVQGQYWYGEDSNSSKGIAGELSIWSNA